MASIQIYPYHFTSQTELDNAIANNKVGTSAGNYKNWIAVITDNLTPKSVQVTSSVSFHVWGGALDSNNKVIPSRILRGDTYEVSNYLLCEDGVSITLEDGTGNIELEC